MIRSFLAKLYAGYAVLVVITALLIGVLVSGRIEQDSLEDVASELRAQAHLLAAIAEPTLDRHADRAILQDRVGQLGRELGTRFTVIGPDGLVLADSDEEPARMDDHGERPEVLGARTGGEATAVRWSSTLERRLMYVAVVVPGAGPDGAGEPRGYVRTALPLTVIDERLAFIRASVFAGAVLGVAVALVLGWFLARRFSRPLTEMTEAAVAMAAGDYDRTVTVKGHDEVARLGEAFREMATQLRDRMNTITRHRNRLLAILGSMVEGVVAIDREERVVHLNAVAAQILRAVPGESVGRRIWEVTRVREVCDVLAEALRETRDVQREARLAASPRDLVVQLRAAPLRDGRGEVVGAVVVIHDDTERHQLDAMRRDFVANVSHEIKTPLTVIRGAVETLLDDPDAPPEVTKRFLEKSVAQCERLSSLLTDLLALSRIESEEGAVERVAVDLRKPVRECVSRLSTEGEKSGITVEVDVPELPVVVSGDEEALRQLTDNLVLNAIKYTSEGGRVWVRVRTEGSEAILEVEDTGIGIEPRHQERIFERFYRVDKARSRAVGGTGLGLAIVKHIAIALDGRATVESVPGKGSTFRVSLPARSPSD